MTILELNAIKDYCDKEANKICNRIYDPRNRHRQKELHDELSLWQNRVNFVEEEINKTVNSYFEVKTQPYSI